MLDWKIYKEGQGKWARNSVAAAIAVFAVVAAIRLYESMTDPDSQLDITGTLWESVLRVSSWPIDYRLVIVAPVLVAVLYFGYWQYNHPGWADFLIETENEMKNKVTWPSRKEEINLSIVVVVTVIIIGGFTFVADQLLRIVFDLVY